MARITDSNILRLLEKSVQFGNWLLVNSVSAHLDRSLEPFISPVVTTENGQPLLALPDKSLFYHPNFRLVFYSSLQRAQIPVDLYNRTTIVNFGITPEQLETQMLALLVSIEAPSLEEKRAEVAKRLALDQGQMSRVENDILQAMSKEDVEQILSNDAMLLRLETSRKMFAEIRKRMRESAKANR